MSTQKPVTYFSRDDAPSDARIVDLLRNAQEELFFVEHPEKKKTDPAAQDECREYLKKEIASVWVHYTRENIVFRIPDEETYFRLRTARNRDLITKEEQAAYRSVRVGIAGLSVGSTAFSTIVATGGSKNIKIADFDTIEITNLNRIRADLFDVGANKADVAARDAWELDPFLDIEVWSKGVAVEQLPEFVSSPRLDVFVDEMDDIRVKINARKVCKEHGIPVVMATDNGDSVILDIERFDLEPERPIFHGRVEIDEAELINMDRAKFIELANRIIDVSYFTPRQWESIQKIGKTLSGVPQIATAASIAGAAVAYAVRMIACKQPLPSGRYVLGCDVLSPATNA